MLKFLETLFRTPARKSLSTLLATAIGIVLNHMMGSSGEVRLPVQEVKDILLLSGGVFCSVLVFAYSYWKKCQPEEQIERARQRGRIICECSEKGEIMLLLSKDSGIDFSRFRCPKCNNDRVVNYTNKTSPTSL